MSSIATITRDETPAAAGTHDAVLSRLRAVIPAIRESAAAAEEARSARQETIDALVAAGMTRILVPPRFGGYGLPLETWFEAMIEIAKVDTSHAWLAGLFIHHPHYVGQFSDEAQQAVWADGPDVLIAASIAPVGRVVRAPGGYRVSGRFSFASGINHSSWLIAVGMTEFGAAPEPAWFLIGPGQFTIEDCWFTAAMRATGSNTAIVDDAFIPEARATRLVDLREGTAPGGKVNANPIFRAPIAAFSPLTFVTPILGAALGVYELFLNEVGKRRGVDGSVIADRPTVQARMARAAANLDAAELLLRRAVGAPQSPVPMTLAQRARSMRDFMRASELSLDAIDDLVAMSGTASFAASHPIQRAWRDAHFAAMHITLSPERNYNHFGRLEFGLPPDPTQRMF